METLRKNKFVALVFILCLLIASGSISLTVYAATHPSWTTTIETGSMIDTASYVVFRDGSTYFAKNGTTGAIDYSGATAATVIQNVFDTSPSSVFFRSGIYDLDGNTVTATSIVRIQGENGGDTVLSGGTLKIAQPSGWNEGFSISDIGLRGAGSIVQLWLLELTEGMVQRVCFYKTSFSAGTPQLLLTNCSSIKIDGNWFDGYNMQIIRLEGNPTPLAGKGTFNRITNNDFGSVNVAFPSFADVSDVAAIYCEGDRAGNNLIAYNIAYMNPESVFFYSDDGYNQVISHNKISAGTENYAIEIVGGHNIVDTNRIGAVATYGKGVNMRTCSYSQIVNNEFYAMDIAINASNTQTCTIENNIIEVYNETSNPSVAINFGLCSYNNIIGNSFWDIGSTPTSYFTDDVNSGSNQISNNYFSNASVFIIDAQVTDVVRYNFCYISENSGTHTISSSTTVTFYHGLDGTPTHVYCGFNVTGYGSWIWSSTSTQITITVNNTGTYHFCWAADIYDSWNG